MLSRSLYYLKHFGIVSLWQPMLIICYSFLNLMCISIIHVYNEEFGMISWVKGTQEIHKNLRSYKY